MSNALVTYYKGEFGYEDIVWGRFSDYCVRIGADFIKIELPDRGDRLHNQLHSIDKFFLINELKETGYDKFLIIDMDVLVRRDSPDIFKLTDNVAAFNEGATFFTMRGCDKDGVYARKVALDTMVAECGLDPLPSRVEVSFNNPFVYYNFGVILIPRDYLWIFEGPRSMYDTVVYGPEQSFFNYQIIKNNIPVYSLPSCFNQMWGDLPCNYLDTTYFLHYAGVPARTEFLLSDDKKWSVKGL